MEDRILRTPPSSLHYSTTPLPLDRLIRHRDAAEDELVALGGEIEKLQHRPADDPLVADQRLDHVRVGIAGTGDEFAGPEFGVEVAPDFAHPVVIALNSPVRVFVLQLDLDQETVAEDEERPPESRLDQAFDGPDFALLFSLAGEDFCLRADEDLFQSCHRIVPMKSERRRNIFDCPGGRNQSENKRERGGASHGTAVYNRRFNWPAVA